MEAPGRPRRETPMKIPHPHLVASLLLLAAVSASEAPPKSVAAIRALREEIARHDELYHRRGTSVISDADYDALREQLARLERDHPAAASSAGAGLPSVSDDRSGELATGNHRAPMLSLAKARTPAALRAFHERLARRFGTEDLAYVVEPKYDGIAVSLTYERGRLIRALTRGDGRSGEDITARVRAISGVPDRLRGDDAPEFIEVRGEIHVPFEEFARVNSARAAAGRETFSNPRALAAGLARRFYTPPPDEAGSLRLVCFGTGACEPASALPGLQHELAARFRSWGLPSVANTPPVRGAEALLLAVDTAGVGRAELAFPTDGVVVKLDSRALQAAAGEGADAPRWALAYKFTAESAETRLLAITVQVGRTGALTPVAELAPVEVGDVIVSRASLHGRGTLARIDARVGDTVRVERAGGVVPAIVGVDLARRPAAAPPFVLPAGCPECGTTVVDDAESGSTRCPAEHCPARVRRRLEHFASKSGVEIEGLGPTLIGALVASGALSEAADLYALRREDLLAAGASGDKYPDRVLGAIARSRSAESWRFIAGLGVPRIGAAAARTLVRRHGTLEAVAAAEPRLREPLEALLRAGITPAAERAAGGRLEGRTLALTGALAGLTRAEATKRIEAAGGRVTGSVGRATDYLVAGTAPGAKLAEARERGVKVIGEKELIALLEGK